MSSKTRHVGAGIPVDRIPYRNPHEPAPTPEQTRKRRIEAFMAAVRSVPGNHVAAALNAMTPGINWFGCSKSHMAQSWAKAHEEIDRQDGRAIAAVDITELAAVARSRHAGDSNWRDAKVST